MFRPRPVGVLYLLGLFLAATAPSTLAADFIQLKDGTVVTGHLLSIDDHSITGLLDPDGEEKTFQREELRPGSWYMVRSRTAGDNLESRMELARFCIANGLFGNAKTELEKVVKVDETLREQAKPLWLEAHEGAAAELLKLAESSAKRKRYSNACRIASMILTEYDETTSAERAGQLLEELHANEEAMPSMQAQVHKHLTEAEVDKLSETDPRAIEARKLQKQARDRNLQGLREKSQTKSRQLFENSINQYKKLLKLADKILEEEKEEPAVVQRVQDFKQTSTDELIEVYVNLGNMLAGRSSYQQAMQVANEAIALAPKSERARSFLSHVQTLAATSSSGWGRGVRR